MPTKKKRGYVSDFDPNDERDPINFDQAPRWIEQDLEWRDFKEEYEKKFNREITEAEYTGMFANKEVERKRKLLHDILGKGYEGGPPAKTVEPVTKEPWQADFIDQEPLRPVSKKELKPAPKKEPLKPASKSEKKALKAALKPAKKGKRKASTAVLNQLRRPLGGFKRGPVRDKKERESTAKEIEKLRSALARPRSSLDLSPLVSTFDKLRDPITDYWVGKREGNLKGYQALRDSGKAERDKARAELKEELKYQRGIAQGDRKEDFAETSAERARQQFIDKGKIDLALLQERLKAAKRGKREKTLAEKTEEAFQLELAREDAKHLSKFKGELREDESKNVDTLKNLGWAIRVLESPESFQMGPVEQAISPYAWDWVRRGWTDLYRGGEYTKLSAMLRQKTRAEGSKTLKRILGGQFAEKEGERIIATIYNPHATNQENIHAIKQFASAYKSALQSLDLMRRYGKDRDGYDKAQAQLTKDRAVLYQLIDNGSLKIYTVDKKGNEKPFVRREGVLKPGREDVLMPARRGE